MSLELIRDKTACLEWKYCDQSGMWKTTDCKHYFWLDETDGGYYIEVDKDQDATDRWFKHHDAVIRYIKRFTEPFLIANKAQCKECGVLLHSKHRHDFVGCVCPQQTRLYIDGGNDYVRCTGAIYNRIDKCVRSDSPHFEIRQSLKRGGYGRDGKQPYTETLLSEMSDEYLDNLIKYIEEYEGFDNKYYSVYLYEKDYRRWHNISIKDI